MEPVQKAAPANAGSTWTRSDRACDPEELDRVRREVSRLAAQSLRGI